MIDTMPKVEGLRIGEQELYCQLIDAWRKNLSKNRTRMKHYTGSVNVAALDLGISVPPPMLRKLNKQSIQWCRKSVDELADCSVFDGFAFMNDEAPEGFEEVMDANSIDSLYDDAKVSALTHCFSLLTVTPGMAGEPKVVINAYDAEHCAVLWDYRHRRILAALTVVDINPKRPSRPTAVNLFTSTNIVECYETSTGKWTSKRHPHSVGRPLAVPLRYAPTLRRPLGTSRLTTAQMECENLANIEVVRLVMHSELYTAPTRWVMGAPDDIFSGERWEAYLGSVFALPFDGELGQAPTTGSYPVGDLTPHISALRQYANMFAAESSIPVHSLMYTEANPASSEAIVASENDLVKKAEAMNRRNGRALREVGLLVCSLIQEVPFDQLDEQARSMKVRWKNPAHPSAAANADAWTKLASSVSSESPLTESRVFWEQQGLEEATVDRVMSDLRRTKGAQVAQILFGASAAQLEQE